MKFENTKVFNFEGAFRGMRNPMESWDKSDTYHCAETECISCPNYENCSVNGIDSVSIGQNDMKLAQSLIKAGSEHRKFMRQIFVSVDITAPMYWWKEFDTYKVGTVANSTSTMHKLASTPITLDCFEMDDFEEVNIDCISQYVENNYDWWNYVITACEYLRQKYNKLLEDKKRLEGIKDFEEAEKAQVMAKKYWKELIRLLPESWLQKRTVTMDYENLLAVCSKGQRRNHKLTEWSKAFIDWARTLPYAQELIFLDELEDKKNG